MLENVARNALVEAAFDYIELSKERAIAIICTYVLRCSLSTDATSYWPREMPVYIKVGWPVSVRLGVNHWPTTTHLGKGSWADERSTADIGMHEYIYWKTCTWSRAKQSVGRGLYQNRQVHHAAHWFRSVHRRRPRRNIQSREASFRWKPRWSSGGVYVQAVGVKKHDLGHETVRPRY